MKSMNKYLLLTSSAIILARVTSAALEADARESKAVVNNPEFNRKFSELTPPSLVIPPFSSAKDYKRLAGICFLGIGDCGGGIKFDKADDYTKGCEPVNPCTGFGLSSTDSCTEGYTSCNTGCETKYKCNPPSYTQSCDYPYQGVGSPLNGKYKSCECRPEFSFGTNDCPSPQVPNTSGADCDGKYSSCVCPSSYSETCNSPFQGVGASCNGKYESCECPANYTLTCEGQQGVGEACNGLYSACTDLPCADQGYTQTCSGLQTGVGEACDGLYKSCECRSDLVSCTGLRTGVGASCNGMYESCECRSDLVSCTSPEVGVGSVCGGMYESCSCPSSYNKTCDGPLETGSGNACNGKYQFCKCRSGLVSCYAPEIGVGESCDGKYISCKCDSVFDKVCTGGDYCTEESSCGGLCSSCTRASDSSSSSGSGSSGSTGGGGAWGGSSYNDDMCSMYNSYC